MRNTHINCLTSLLTKSCQNAILINATEQAENLGPAANNRQVRLVVVGAVEVTNLEELAFAIDSSSCTCLFKTDGEGTFPSGNEPISKQDFRKA